MTSSMSLPIVVTLTSDPKTTIENKIKIKIKIK